MKLHWSPKSPYVRKVMIAAHELGIADRLTLERSVAAMTAPNRTIMEDNPLAKIPTLVLDDGSAIYDSRVICEYFDSLAQGTLFPVDGRARWQNLTWQSLGDGLLDILILWRNERERPPEHQAQSWLSGFAMKTEAGLDRLDNESEQLAAAPFAMGHISIGCMLGYLDFRFAALNWRSGRPGLARWHESFTSRPSAKATEIVDG